MSQSPCPKNPSELSREEVIELSQTTTYPLGSDCTDVEIGKVRRILFGAFIRAKKENVVKVRKSEVAKIKELWVMGAEVEEICAVARITKAALLKLVSDGNWGAQEKTPDYYRALSTEKRVRGISKALAKFTEFREVMTPITTEEENQMTADQRTLAEQRKLMLLPVEDIAELPESRLEEMSQLLNRHSHAALSKRVNQVIREKASGDDDVDTLMSIAKLLKEVVVSGERIYGAKEAPKQEHGNGAINTFIMNGSVDAMFEEKPVQGKTIEAP